MIVPARLVRRWFRGWDPGSMDRDSRDLLLLLCALIVGGSCLLLWTPQLGTVAQLALCTALVAGLALAARWRGLAVLGPVFGHELVRMARRRRYFVMRVLYVVGLLALLGWLYGIWLLEIRIFRRGPRGGDMALFASSFFYLFIGIQYAIVVLLTPIYTAGTIAEEKDRKTMEFVLATDLRDHEIVLGKWLARLANLTLLILAGLPVFSALQFLGGIDPELMLAAFAATGLTMLSLGALGVLCSVLTKKTRDAIVLTFLLALVYLAASGASWFVFFPVTGRRGGPSVADILDFLPWEDIVRWLSAGNIGSVVVRIGLAFDRGGRIDTVLAEYLRDFALFHGLATVVMLACAVARLRVIALRQAFAPVRARFRWGLGQPRPRNLPPVGDRPMIWKEVHAERGVKLHVLFRLAIGLLVVGSLVPAAVIVFTNLVVRPSWAGTNSWERLSRDMNVWVRVVGTGVACLMLLAVAVRAAVSISGERDKQTFDGLITTSLSGYSILLGKWLGSIFGLRWGLIWLATIWGIGLVTSGLHPLGLLFLPVSWFIYAAMFAMIGLWFSMRSATSLRATISTLLAVIGVSGGHWVVMGVLCYAPLKAVGVRYYSLEWLIFLQIGHTPPAMLFCEAIHRRDLARIDHTPMVYLTVSLLLGGLIWLGLTWQLWRASLRRFKVILGLTPLQTQVRTSTPTRRS